MWRDVIRRQLQFAKLRVDFLTMYVQAAVPSVLVSGGIGKTIVQCALIGFYLLRAAWLGGRSG